MENLTLKVMPYLDTARGWISTFSEFVARGLELDPVNVNIIIIGLISFLIGKWIFNMFHVNTEGRLPILVIIVGVIFYFLKYF